MQYKENAKKVKKSDINRSHIFLPGFIKRLLPVLCGYESFFLICSYAIKASAALSLFLMWRYYLFLYKIFSDFYLSFNRISSYMQKVASKALSSLHFSFFRIQSMMFHILLCITLSGSFRSFSPALLYDRLYGVKPTLVEFLQYGYPIAPLKPTYDRPDRQFHKSSPPDPQPWQQ